MTFLDVCASSFACVERGNVFYSVAKRQKEIDDEYVAILHSVKWVSGRRKYTGINEANDGSDSFSTFYVSTVSCDESYHDLVSRFSILKQGNSFTSVTIIGEMAVKEVQ